MKIKFKDINFRADSLGRIKQCNEIIKRYQEQGLRLTLRQLYYQLVVLNVIPNKERSYKNLSTLVSDARLAGIMDWNAIEDRVRQPRLPPEFDSLGDLIEAAVNSYRLPRWEGQEFYAELWVEKDALAGVLAPIAREFHVTMMVNRGYSSMSAMYESANRFTNHENQRPVLFYLGDHDPSGEDMVRDIRDRLLMFGVDDIDVRKIALTMKQVEEYNPPPNPAKLTDPRSSGYIAEHGSSSWEVDALPPETLAMIIKKHLNQVLDRLLMNSVIERENKDKALLRKLVTK
jgi:hypothetical protein